MKQHVLVIVWVATIVQGIAIVRVVIIHTAGKVEAHHALQIPQVVINLVVTIHQD